MTDTTRSLLLLLFFCLLFLFGYWGYITIDDSYRHNEPQYVLELEAENDRLETVRDDLKEELEELQEKVEDLVDEDSESAPVESDSVEVIDE